MFVSYIINLKHYLLTKKSSVLTTTVIIKYKYIYIAMQIMQLHNLWLQENNHFYPVVDLNCC